MSTLTGNVIDSNTDGVSRGVVNYTSRDYESIMADFWDLVPKMTELWKPEADADPAQSKVGKLPPVLLVD